MKDLSPVMFDDFVKPFQINLEEVLDGPIVFINFLKINYPSDYFEQLVLL